MYQYPRSGGGSAREIRQDSRAQEAILGVSEMARNGHIVESISIPASQSLAIAHKLGRVPKGWLILSPRGTCFAMPVMTSRDGQFITLQSDDDAIFDLLVW